MDDCSIKHLTLVFVMALAIGTPFIPSAQARQAPENPAADSTQPQFDQPNTGLRPDWWRLEDATPGVKLRLHEDGGTASGQHRQGQPVTVRLETRGFPRDKFYELWSSRLDGRTNRVLGLHFNETGELEIIVAGKTIGGFSGRLVFEQFARGEAISLALVSADHEIKAFARFVPFPMEARQGACRIWLELGSSDGLTFFLFGEGFAPNEEVRTVARSGSRKVQGRLTISSDGSLPVTLLRPAAIGRQHKASYEVIGNSCDITIDYEWGPPALKKQ